MFLCSGWVLPVDFLLLVQSIVANLDQVISTFGFGGIHPLLSLQILYDSSEPLLFGWVFP